MKLRYNGVEYSFDYDFASNDETNADCPQWTRINDEHGLDGSIHVHSITVKGKLRPVTTEVLAMMERAAAIEEFVTVRWSWVESYRKAGLEVPPRLLQDLEVVSHLGRISVGPPARRPQA